MSSSARACKATVLSPSASRVDGSVPLRGAEHWAEAMHRADASLWAECAGESCLVSYSCEKRSADVISYSAGGRESQSGTIRDMPSYSADIGVDISVCENSSEQEGQSPSYSPDYHASAWTAATL